MLSAQKLHYDCTMIACGEKSNNREELTFHMCEMHHMLATEYGGYVLVKNPNPIIKLNVKNAKHEEDIKSSTKAASQETVSSPSFVQDVAVKSSTSGAGEEIDPSTDEEVKVRKITVVRPSLTRWASRLNRNAMANPGASQWGTA